MITSTERALLYYLNEYIHTYGRPPTQQEIANSLMKSRRYIRRLLDRLYEAGYIERDSDVTRGLRLTNKASELYDKSSLLNEPVPTFSGSLKIPLVGYIFAGEPVEIGDEFPLYNADTAIELGPNVLSGRTDDLVALRVIGESMIDALVTEGDIVILKPQDHAHNGDMAVMWLSSMNSNVLKHFYREDDNIRLQPANPKLEPMFVKPDDVQVQGKVLMVIRQLLEPDNWRLDAAVPDQVYLDQAFELVVAIRPSSASVLDVPELNRVSSTDLQFNWSNSELGARLQVQVTAPDCEIHNSNRQTIEMLPDRYPLLYFLLTPKKIGKIKIVVTVSREENWLGNAPLTTISQERIVGNIKIEIKSKKLSKYAKVVLRKSVEDLFSIDEIRILCFDLDIPFEDLTGNTKSTLVVSLMDYCMRYGLMGEFVESCKQQRPNFDWELDTGQTVSENVSPN